MGGGQRVVGQVRRWVVVDGGAALVAGENYFFAKLRPRPIQIWIRLKDLLRIDTTLLLHLQRLDRLVMGQRRVLDILDRCRTMSSNRSRCLPLSTQLRRPSCRGHRYFLI